MLPNNHHLIFIQQSKNFVFDIVNYASSIENMFDEIILIDLARDIEHYAEFLKFTQSINFEKKKQLVQIILRSYYSDELKRYPDIWQEIEKLQRLRNNLAHSSKSYQAFTDDHYHMTLENPIIKLKIDISPQRMNDLQQKFERTYQNFFKILQKTLKDRRYSIDDYFENKYNKTD